MSEDKDKPLTPDDLQVRSVHVDYKKLRELIEGLRALPNVSDMAIINTIAELDRMVLPFEHNDRIRARLVEQAAQIAEKKSAAIAAVIRTTGAIPSDIMSTLLDNIMGERGHDRAVHPTCDCPRCTSAREAAQMKGGSASLQ